MNNSRKTPGARLLYMAHCILLVCYTAMVFAEGEQHAIGAGADDLPIFDAHMHYKRDAWEPVPVATVLSLMDSSGVAMALVSSTPDQGTIRLLEYAPSRIVPEVRPYRGSTGSRNWMQSEGVVDYLSERMEKYPHVGIGEFHVHQLDIKDRPLLAQVARLAKQHNALIHIHSGAEAVRLMYKLEPSLTIIWAHVGMTEPPAVAAAMFERYPRLYADTSYREYEILGNGVELDPAWRKLIEKYRERLMIGSDTWVNRQWAIYESLIETNREWLRLLPRSTAEMIAYRNAEKLFGRKVSRQLLGKR